MNRDKRRARRTVIKSTTKRGLIPVGKGVPDILAKIDFKIIWYSLVLWLVSTLISGLVILPWFYIVLSVFVFIMVVFAFRKIRVPKSIYRRRQDILLMKGLWIGLFWSFAIFVFDLVEFIGFSVTSLDVYFTDLRNWFKYPLFILMPVIYALMLENSKGNNFRKVPFLGRRIFPEQTLK